MTERLLERTLRARERVANLRRELPADPPVSSRTPSSLGGMAALRNRIAPAYGDLDPVRMAREAPRGSRPWSASSTHTPLSGRMTR